MFAPAFITQFAAADKQYRTLNTLTRLAVNCMQIYDLAPPYPQKVSTNICKSQDPALPR